MIDSLKVENNLYIVTEEGKETNTGIAARPGDIMKITFYNAGFYRKGIWHSLLITDDRLYIKANAVFMKNITAKNEETNNN